MFGNFCSSLSETKAIISTGPVSLKEFVEEENQQSFFTHSSLTSSIFSSPIGTSSGSDTIAAASSVPRFGTSSWFGQPIVPDLTFPLGQALANPLPMWFPRHDLVMPVPLLGMGFRPILGRQSVFGVPFEYPEVPVYRVPGLSLEEPEVVGLNGDYVADEAARLVPAPDEELRGDIFMNYKWEQKPWQGHAWDTRGSVPEVSNSQTNKRESDYDYNDFDLLRHSRMSFRPALDGTNTLYKGEENNPNLDDQEVRKSRVMLTGQNEPERLNEDEVRALLDMLR